MIDFRFSSALIPAFSLVLVTACGGGGTGSTSTAGAGGSMATGTTASSTGAGGATASATTGTGAPMCDLDLYSDRPPCQTRVDSICCAEEKACAADSDCVDFVNCLFDCPVPKDEPCLNTCGMKASAAAQAKLTAVGHCSSMHPPLADQSCAFP
ncbi:MAG: hypothetical protein ABJE95_25110 [Byssovorax sp.]